MTVIIVNGATNTNSINVLYQNIFADGSLSWSSQTSGNNAVNATVDETWNAWRPASVEALLSVDYGSSVACDMFGIAAHDMALNGSGFQLQYSTNGADWVSVNSIYSPIIDDTIIMCFPSTSARYWRLRVVYAVANIGVVRLGSKLTFANAPLDGHRPIHHSKKVEMLSNTSVGGNLLGNRVVKLGAETSVNVGMVDRDWAESDLLGFEYHYNNGGAFFYCGAPSDIPKDTGYCWRPQGGGEMSVTWVEGDIMADVSFDLVAHVAA